MGGKNVSELTAALLSKNRQGNFFRQLRQKINFFKCYVEKIDKNVLFNWLVKKKPLLAVLFWLQCRLSSSGSSALAWLSCPADPVLAVGFRLSSPADPVLAVIFAGRSVLPVLSWLFFLPAVLSCRICPDCPFLAVLPCQSWPGCSVPAVMSRVGIHKLFLNPAEILGFQNPGISA